jgi:choline dehydrogenase
VPAEYFIEAATRRGALTNDDFNGDRQDGVGFYQVLQAGGQRCGVADAYLANRPQNLTVVTDALVTGLVIEGGRAAGVTYRRNGSQETARAAAEVILSAGAVGTPQLLMLSGIGPADHLRSHGIYVIADLPAVGANLIDQPAVPVLWSTPGVKGLWESSGNSGFLRWRLTRKGPLTSNVAEAGGFARSEPRLPAPDLQWRVLPVAYREQGLTDPASRAMTVLVGLADVASRGRLRLASGDPRHRPLIDPGYLSDPRDLNALAVGVRMARDYGTAAPLSRICAAELTPGDGVHTDCEIREFIARVVTSAHHPAGTCAMSGDAAKSASGYDSVVDPQLRVRGVAGLRIVDASVMPTLPRGDAIAPVTAIAERAADLIAGRAPLVPQDPEAAVPPLSAVR